MEEFSAALESIDLKITKYDPEKQRSIHTSVGAMSIEKFCKKFMADLGRDAVKFPKVFDILHDLQATKEMVEEYAETNELTGGKIKNRNLPDQLKNLTLNFDLSATGRSEKFFTTHPDETIADVSGEAYLMLSGLSPVEAAAQARLVFPEYMPREPSGVTEITIDEKTKNVFNVYTPPRWTTFKKMVPDKLPLLFEELVDHLFPLEIEKEYFYAWLYESLFNRAFVFLVLCGIPGSGKNRLKLILRALHGHVNSIDGKKSTLVERFNSQLSEATLAWFDELHYDHEMENTMKELQNDTISIERKGIDATRATKIYSSIVISNNKPRDNYIAFDARKFVPLVINEARLEKSMDPRDIDRLTKKVEDATSETYDVAFLAQIGRWIQKHGRSTKWPNLEYRGPKFWMLAHTSMTKWQKKAVTVLMDPNARTDRNGYDEDRKSFLWSVVQEKSTKKSDKSFQFPDYTSVQAFFEVFRDADGRKAFSTETIKENNILGDFWVKPLFKNTEIVSENSITFQREKANAKIKKPKYDL